MSREIIKEAVTMGSRLGYAFLATADNEGLPHMTVSGRLDVEADGNVSISQWFCPGTLANLEINPRISIVAWDPVSDTGYQMLATYEKAEDLSMMNGLSPETEDKAPLPQVERKILVRVDKVLRFSLAPHSDVEE